MLSQRRQILTPKHSGSDNTTSGMPPPLPLSLENSPGLLRPPDKE